MAMLRTVCALVCSIAMAVCFTGCLGGGGESIDVEGDDVSLDEEAKGGSCPSYVSCPSSLTGYPVFMYAINSCAGSLACWYRQSAYPYAVSSTTVPTPTACPVCRATGYTDPRCGTVTYSQSWTCSAQ